MAWGQSRPVRMKGTWGAQLKQKKNEVVKETEPGEIWSGSRTFGRKSEKVNRRR